MPNITGKLIAGEFVDAIMSSAGALYGKAGGTSPSAGEGTANGLYFDASRSNAIYGASSTVQPPAIVLIPQIKF